MSLLNKKTMYLQDYNEDGMPPVWESWEQYYNETYGTTKQ